MWSWRSWSRVLLAPLCARDEFGPDGFQDDGVQLQGVQHRVVVVPGGGVAGPQV